MSKKNNSVSRIITVDKKVKMVCLKYAPEHYLSFFRLSWVGIKIPKGDYKVTYTLSKRGKYRVGGKKRDGSLHIYPCDKPGPEADGLELFAREYKICWACWLPGNWEGKRVSRRVELLKPKKH